METSFSALVGPLVCETYPMCTQKKLWNVEYVKYVNSVHVVLDIISLSSESRNITRIEGTLQLSFS